MVCKYQDNNEGFCGLVLWYSSCALRGLEKKTALTCQSYVILDAQDNRQTHLRAYFATRSAPHSLPRLAICLASHPGSPSSGDSLGTKFHDTFGDSEVPDPGPIGSRPECHIWSQPSPRLGHRRHFATHFAVSPLAPAPLPGVEASENAPVTEATSPSLAPPGLLPAVRRGSLHLGVKPESPGSPRRPAPPAGAARDSQSTSLRPDARGGSAPRKGAAGPRGRRSQPAAVLLSAAARCRRSPLSAAAAAAAGASLRLARGTAGRLDKKM
ncbi:uncharacterized protein LOC120600374 [Pteropus medius]|uniref:uncharacterized protein LOC120600374 n=1 Tax=Pteropus vampyrus TaxID=132908 RepID=UPI00196A8F75|nr:uncharacterized protein LOC120600374 [Pteropus giganteus]